MFEPEGSGGSPSSQRLVVLNEGRRSWRGMLREPLVLYTVKSRRQHGDIGARLMQAEAHGVGMAIKLATVGARRAFDTACNDAVGASNPSAARTAGRSRTPASGRTAPRCRVHHDRAARRETDRGRGGTRTVAHQASAAAAVPAVGWVCRSRRRPYMHSTKRRDGSVTCGHQSYDSSSSSSNSWSRQHRRHLFHERPDRHSREVTG